MERLSDLVKQYAVCIGIFILCFFFLGPYGGSPKTGFEVSPVFALESEAITSVTRKICPPPLVYKDTFTPTGSAFDSPQTFANSTTAYFDGKESSSNDFYVAISQDEYEAQGGDGEVCPWDKILVRRSGTLELVCPYGNDENNNGRSYLYPFSTFKHALAEMKEHKENNRRIGHYTLYIRGSIDTTKDFYYSEPIYLGTYTADVEEYAAPLLYDMYGNPVKIDSSTGDLIFKDCDDSYDDSKKYVVTNITVKPYNNEHVVLNGGCEFSYWADSADLDGDEDYEELMEPGHPGWDNNGTSMSRDCGDFWPDKETTGTLDYEIYNDNDFGMVTVRYGYNITIEGLHVTNSPSHGIRVLGGRGGSNVLIADNVIDNTYGTGVITQYGSNYVVRDNSVKRAAAGSKYGGIHFSEVEDFVFFNNIVTKTYNDAGISGGNDVYYGSVLNNLIYENNIGTGIYINGTVDGVGAVRYDSNIIHDNVYAQCYQVGSEGNLTTEPGPIKNIILTNNICYNNLHGIWLGGYCQADRWDTCDEVFDTEEPDPTEGNDCCGFGVPMSDIYVLNNSVWGNGIDEDGLLTLGGENPYVNNPPAGYGFRMDNLGASNVIVMNNIFAENTVQQTKVQNAFNDDGTLDTTKLDLENNITYCRGTDDDGDGNLDCLEGYIGSADLQVDPMFADRLNGNFHLQFPSPAIDRAINVLNVPVVDFEDDKRVCIEVLGGLSETRPGCPDIGADEYRVRLSR